MIVITLTDCPISLRGDLSKWLIEINTGVFVGKLSARVRDQLWKRVKDNVKNGRATMVYSTNNEQRMDFRIHNSQNQIIDFDGLKLVMKPSASRTKQLEKKRRYFSKAAQMRIGQKRKYGVVEDKTKAEVKKYPSEYVVLDLETTGLCEKIDEIIEIGMLKVSDGKVVDTFQSLVKNKRQLSRPIEKITGITQAMLHQSGRPMEEIIGDVKAFIGNHCIVGHNISFDMGFLNHAIAKVGIRKLDNLQYDTMRMYAEKTTGTNLRKSLVDMVKALGISEKPCHRSIQDCRAVMAVYEVLRQDK